MRLISQLINGISRILQKLLRFFNGTAISTFFDSTSGVFPFFKFWIWMIQNFLYYHLIHLYNIAINFLMFLNNYHYIQLDYTFALQHLYLLQFIWVLFISLTQSVNGAQFLIVLLYFFHLLALQHHYLLLQDLL